jgi:hypothetical protein
MLPEVAAATLRRWGDGSVHRALSETPARVPLLIRRPKSRGSGSRYTLFEELAFADVRPKAPAGNRTRLAAASVKPSSGACVECERTSSRACAEEASVKTRISGTCPPVT